MLVYKAGDRKGKKTERSSANNTAKKFGREIMGHIECELEIKNFSIEDRDT